MGTDIYDQYDYWDLSSLVKKKNDMPIKPFSTTPTVVLIEDEEEEQCEKTEMTPTSLSFAGEARSFTDDSYEPCNMSLIHRVIIRHFNDRYDFYDGFRKSALLYYDVHGVKCDFVPFYSYMPQYTQMNAAQKSYYFYLRDEIRRGNYIHADYSYVYLYVYEIFNLPEKIAPEVGITLLCDLWRAYRKDLPRIDKLFSLWIEDYCLVWKLPSPTEKISDFIFDILKGCPLKEFYLSDIRTACLNGVLSLVSALSDYDWRCGRYATGESAKVYRAHMEGALSFALAPMLEKELRILKLEPMQKLSRDAFVNSLCTHSVKCRLEIEYHSLDQLSSLRDKVSNLVRYVENHLRKQLGVKSRLTIKNLPEEYSQLVDMYFQSVFKAQERKVQVQRIPEYERQYDAPVAELSYHGAREIEEESWETTFRLVSEIADDVCDENVSIDMQEVGDAVAISDVATEKTPQEGMEDPSSTGNEDYVTVLSMLLFGKLEEAKAFSVMKKVPIEYYVDAINTLFLDIVGDNVIEGDDMTYTVIEDYKEDVEQWLNN